MAYLPANSMRERLKEYQREHLLVTLTLPGLGMTHCRIMDVGWDCVDIMLQPDSDNPAATLVMTVSLMYIVSVVCYKQDLLSEDEDCADLFTGLNDYKTGPAQTRHFRF